MIFLLISSDRQVQSTSEFSKLDWHKIKSDELVAVSVELTTGNVFRYSTTSQEWIRQ